jgi:hypothetical protein
MPKDTPKVLDLSGLRSQMRNRVEEELERQLREIPKTVEKIVESAVLSILGIDKCGRGYKVDSWGQSETLNGYIQRKTEAAMHEVVGPIVEKELKRVSKLVTLRRDMALAISSNAQYQLESAFREAIGDRYKSLGEKLAKQVGDELDKMLDGTAKFNDDVFDPDSFQGRIGRLFLEELAEQASENS